MGATLRVVRSGSTSNTSHIVAEGFADDVMTTVCGATLKKTANTKIEQQGHVTCRDCVSGWVARSR